MTQEVRKGSGKVSVWFYLWHLICYKPKLYLINNFLGFLVSGFPLLPGLIIREFFNTLTGESQLGLSPSTLIFLLMILGLGYVIVAFVGDFTTSQVRFSLSSLLRRNLLAHLLVRPGAQSLRDPRETDKTISPGELISYFRDDAFHIENNVVRLSQLIGHGGFALGSVAILLRINARITLFIFLPLLVMLIVIRQAETRIKRYQWSSRRATQQVTGFVGEMFSAVQAIKVAGAEKAVIAHFRKMNVQRFERMLRIQLLNSILNSLFQNLVNIGTAGILILVSYSIRAGVSPPSIGDLALFVYFLTFVSQFLSKFGEFIALTKQSEVSFERLGVLLSDTPVLELESQGRRKKVQSPAEVPTYALVAPHPLYLDYLWCRPRSLPPVEQPRGKENTCLQELRAESLTYLYPDTDRGIRDVSLKIVRGSLTVITGRVGSGKTTLLRVLLGWLPLQAGAIYWNGRQVHKPANFFVPPRSAYTPQTPKFFSYSLRENLLLGLDINEGDLEKAIQMAVFESDVAAMPEGLATQVGPKGVRLSGGQIQRAAAARMLVRQTELLVMDDLSSALDVKTEQKLWECLFAARSANTGWTPTCLVVSHRPYILNHADQIIVLRDGQLDRAFPPAQAND